MLLLTWHGTIVCRREDDVLIQRAPAGIGPADAPVDLDTADIPPSGTTRNDALLGPIILCLAPLGRGISIARGEKFLCAERDGSLAFDRPAAHEWESFLAISRESLDSLADILGHRWIVGHTRRIVRRGQVRLADGFRLLLDDAQVDLTACLPFARRGRAEIAAEGFTLGQGETAQEIFRAEPRSSALVNTALWPVRARRTAEMLVLATHRQLAGREPPQAEFEQDVEFLMDRRGAAALEDLMETVRDRAGLAQRVVSARLPPETPVAGQTVVSLGTACIVACLLRRLNLLPVPFPFDWLGSTPGMVRHCLETGFAVLLDRSEYRSLTGTGGADEPEKGCSHEYYRREFGIARLFNHNDPTQEPAFRYTQTSVDRLRDLLASAAPKLFVQVRDASPEARQDFEVMTALLDRLTRNASLLQVAVHAPDRRQAMPLLTLAVRQGAHALYRMHPTSQLGGEAFIGAADNDLLAGLIAAHAARPATTRAVAQGDRMAVQAAMRGFGAARLPSAWADEAGRHDIINRANVALLRFLEQAGIPRRYRFGMFDRTQTGRQLTGEACIVNVAGPQTTLRFDINGRDPWTLLHRALPLIYVLDGVTAAGGKLPEHFFGEFGDRGFEPRSVTYCSNLPGSCLLPDSDFVATGGYDELRRQVRDDTLPWQSRTRTVFWRGATTGGRRHPAPVEGAPDDFTWLPRLDVCARAQRSTLAAHFDVGISNICQIEEPHLRSRIAGANLCRPPVPRRGFLGHKGLLVIDGNSNAWSALFCALLTGACVLKVESPKGFRQWYYDVLVPGVNFLPIAEDLGDLDDQVAWLLSHDDEARAIGQAGRALALSLTFERVMEDAANRLRAWFAS